MPALEIHSEWAKALAEQLVASGDAPPAELSDDERLALAWALKDLAYGGWSTDPPMVARARAVLLQLCNGDCTVGRDINADEINAVFHWISGIAAITRGRMTDATNELDHAQALFQALNFASFSAQTQISKMIALSMLGRRDEAAKCGEGAQKIFVDLNELHAASKVSLNLGYLYTRCNEFSMAQIQFALATSLFARLGDNEYTLRSEVGMADACASMGEFDKALRIYARSDELASEHGFPVIGAVIEESIALVRLARGDYRDALRGLEGSLRRYELLEMPQHVAMAEKQLADAYFDVRLLPEALTLFEHALSRFEALEMHVEQAWTLSQYGRVLSALGHPSEEIAKSLLRATNLFSSHGVSAGQATVLLARAELAIAQGDAKTAEALAEEAASIFTRAGMAAGVVQSDEVRANALLLSKRISDATSLFSDTLGAARTLQLLTMQSRCLVGLGLAAQSRGDVVSAKTNFEMAIALFEEQRGALPGDEFRSAFLIDHLRPYEALLRIALDAFDLNSSSENATQALHVSERFRARALGERLGQLRTHDTVVTDTTESHLRAQLNWLYRRSQKLLDDGENNQMLVEQSRGIERDLLEIGRRKGIAAKDAGAITEPVRLDANALLAHLGQHEALIEYGLLDGEVFACVVTRSGVALRRHVAKWIDVAAAIRTARFQIETLRSGAGAMDRHLELLSKRSKVALRRLHDLIWSPLSDLLNDSCRVFVVPHEQLGSVPFAALHDGEHYLSQLCEFAVAPSASVALRGLRRPPSVLPRHAVIVGESSRLAHAVEEAQFVASLFEQATVLIGQDANGDALRAASVQADVLHLACHGQFRSDNPMFSALHLVDGPFTVQDAEALRLPQGTVVLSACESGVATASKGDEVIGLVRAFLIAGAARVVASLWPVDDKVTTEFMAVFYSSLRAGASPTAALRSAQLEVMKTHPHPFHWAAFTVYGGW